MYLEDFLKARITAELAKPVERQISGLEHFRGVLNTIGWIRYNPDVPSPHTSIMGGIAALWSDHPDWSERFPATPSTEKRTEY